MITCETSTKPENEPVTNKKQKIHPGNEKKQTAATPDPSILISVRYCFLSTSDL